MRTNSTVRYIAAGLAAAAGVLYLLIAGGFLQVLSTAPQPGDAVVPGIAGAAFVLLAAAVALFANRAVETIGVAMAVIAIIGYFVVAPNRTPQYETWGIVIKFIQGALAIALGYLVLHRSAGELRAKALS